MKCEGYEFRLKKAVNMYQHSVNHHSFILNILRQTKASGWWGFGVFILGLSLTFINILSLNHGAFIYTLDDPYIHLALAENMARFHYGVNLGEFSSPSSSILWPLLLAPFMGFSFAEYVPLAINLAAAFLTLFLAWRFFSRLFYQVTSSNLLIGFLLVCFIFLTNLIGLIFNGMEHSLHVLLAVMVTTGLIEWAFAKRQGEPVPSLSWVWVGIVLLPLVRYEGLALSGFALGFLFLQGHYKSTTLVGFFIVSLLVGFSYFLVSLGLETMPASILAKSKVMYSGGRLDVIAHKLMNHLTAPRFPMRLHLLVMGILIFFACRRSLATADRQIAALLLVALMLHFIFGDFGWFRRYEIYIWSSVLCGLIYLGRDMLTYAFIRMKWVVFLAGFLLVTAVFTPYLGCVRQTPTASNNIYEQQYQMHRFAKMYNKPIAVNDLGFVSWRNDQYVLDLWGLASTEALKELVSAREAREAAKQSGAAFDEQARTAWMQRLAKEHKVEFAMLYEKGFVALPKEWVKVAELKLSRKLITPAYETVAFYAMNAQVKETVQPLLETFKQSLPKEVIFNILAQHAP
jgi:hypothetical protein